MNNVKEELNLNNTFSLYPRDKALGPLLLSTHAKNIPEQTALQFGATAYSYKQLNDKVNQLTHLLSKQGITIGDKVGLCLDRSAEMVICFLAILKTGAAYIPLDPGYPMARLQYILEDAEAKVLITSKELSYFPGTPEQTIYVEDAFNALNKYETDELQIEVGGNDLAYILYTSGSTGKPKGVQIEHHSLVNLLLSIQKAPGMQQGDVLFSITTISFDIFGLELYLPLLCGGTLLMADKDVSRDGRKILDIVRAEKVNILQATPYTWKMLLEAGWNEYLPVKAFCGGEALTRNLIKKLLPQCAELWNMYGPTETTIYSTIKKIEDTEAPVTIGKPINNTTVYILDEEGKQQEPGGIGEICIGGDGLARGYLKRPELNNEKFIKDNIGGAPGKRLYRTGDLGRITPEGEIMCLGRIDHQIKIRGLRIEAEEIEENLVKLNNIADAIVTVRTDTIGNQRLVAYVINKSKIEEADLKTYINNWGSELKNSLPDYMLPQAYMPVTFFPKTPNGKIDRNALPEPAYQSVLTEYKTAETETEKKLLGIWQQYLGIRNLGINDDFFDLGGHSIIAVQIMMQIEKQMGLRLSISSFFNQPTVRTLAKLIDSNETETGRSSLICIKEGTHKSPLYIIHGIGLNVLIFHDLAKYLDPRQPVYGLQAIGLDGKDEPLSDFKEIAACYIKEILEQNPDGPFNLLGYSMGGFLALEMTQQLQQMNKPVAFLGMLDTNLKKHDGNRKLTILTNKILRQFPKALFALKSLLKHPGRTLDYQYSIIKWKLINSFRTNKIRKEVANDEIPAYMEKIISALEEGMKNYEVRPYKGKLFLFKVEERIYYVDDPKYLGWKAYAQGGIELKIVPGDHKLILSPPNVATFADSLQEVLDAL